MNKTEYKIAGESTFGDQEDPQRVVVEVLFDFASNQVSFYTLEDQGNISLHLDKEDLKRLLSIFDKIETEEE